jgi:hypothetical protein
MPLPTMGRLSPSWRHPLRLLPSARPRDAMTRAAAKEEENQQWEASAQRLSRQAPSKASFLCSNIVLGPKECRWREIHMEEEFSFFYQ